MARQSLTEQTAPGPDGNAAADLTFAAAVPGVGNGEQFDLQGDEVVIAQNTGVAPHTVTCEAVIDSLGRTHVGTKSIAAGAFAMFGPFFPTEGWKQSTGKMYLNADDVSVKFAVIRIPRG